MAFKFKKKFDGITNKKLGENVSIYGRYAASSGVLRDQVVVYERENSNWSQLQLINLAETNFELSLEMYKNELFITFSTAFENVVLVYSATNDFTPLSPYAVFRGSLVDGFGKSLSVSNNYIVTGSPEEDGNKGAVFLYSKNSNQDWNEIAPPSSPSTENQYIQPNDAVSNQYFGNSVAINEDFMAVGARGDNLNSGAVYIYQRNKETGIWTQFQKLIAPDGENSDEFGFSVSISGDYLAVGSPFADLSEEENNVGAVYLFKYTTDWNFLRKITGIGESGLIANTFGYSLDLQDDFLIVGSPNARNRGVVDIFSKKRNWGHLKKIVNPETSDDSFGSDVSIHYPYAIIGAFEYDLGSDEGRIEFYEDPPVRIRLAQEFEVEGDYLPTKASVYLKRNGENDNSFWLLSEEEPTTIDSTNFSSISESVNRAIFDDRVLGFTGNGYMIISPEQDDSFFSQTDDSFSIINYPIKSSESNFYNLWLRCYINSDDPSGGMSSLNADIFLDNIIIRTLNEIVTIDDWVWVKTSIVIPDSQLHNLGIKIKENSLIIDKIYLDANTDFIPEGEGPAYSISPYVTTHMRVYSGSDSVYPVYPLYIYDYKTTLDEIIQDDWYNFNINIMGQDELVKLSSANNISITSITGLKIPFDDTPNELVKLSSTNNISITSITGLKIPFDDTPNEFALDGNFFLVMSSSGSNSENFVTWENIDSNEYLSRNAALRLTENGLNNNYDILSLTNRIYYSAKAGEADINTDTWYLDNTKTYAFKIYSDFDPIRDI